MVIIGKKGLSGIFEIILKLIFVGGAVIWMTLPLCLKWYLEYNKWYDNAYYINLLFLLYTTGVLALAIILAGIKMLKNINNNEIFINNNSKILKRIGIYSLIIAIIYLLTLPIIKSFFMIILFMTFTILGFIAIILAELFKSAIKYKEENELTI